MDKPRRGWVHENSVKAYREVRGKIAEGRQKAVLDWLADHGPATCPEITVGLGARSRDFISPRMKELKTAKAVVVVGKRRNPKTGKDVELLDLTGVRPLRREPLTLLDELINTLCSGCSRRARRLLLEKGPKKYRKRWVETPDAYFRRVDEEE